MTWGLVCQLKLTFVCSTRPPRSLFKWRVTVYPFTNITVHICELIRIPGPILQVADIPLSIDEWHFTFYRNQSLAKRYLFTNSIAAFWEILCLLPLRIWAATSVMGIDSSWVMFMKKRLHPVVQSRCGSIGATSLVNIMGITSTPQLEMTLVSRMYCNGRWAGLRLTMIWF